MAMAMAMENEGSIPSGQFLNRDLRREALLVRR